MNDNDIKRIPRLSSILILLQTKKLLTAIELAQKFSVSKRTIYRDLKALEQAGVPLFVVEGKGYSLMEGYSIPPVMFSESEANALITAEQIITRNKDESFVKDYQSAIHKIKSVLRTQTKEKANLLANRTISGQNWFSDRTSNSLSLLQLALTNFKLVAITYHSPYTQNTTDRIVEPFALYTTQENWLLIAFCRLRNDFRAFRLDRIKKLNVLSDSFTPHELSLQEYIDMINKKND